MKPEVADLGPKRADKLKSMKGLRSLGSEARLVSLESEGGAGRA